MGFIMRGSAVYLSAVYSRARAIWSATCVIFVMLNSWVSFVVLNGHVEDQHRCFNLSDWHRTKALQSTPIRTAVLVLNMVGVGIQMKPMSRYAAKGNCLYCWFVKCDIDIQ